MGRSTWASQTGSSLSLSNNVRPIRELAGIVKSALVKHWIMVRIFESRWVRDNVIGVGPVNAGLKRILCAIFS